LEKLLELLFGSPWWLVLTLGVYGVCWATYKDLPDKEPSRKRWIGYLTQNTWSNRYRKLLRNMLDWVDAWLTPEISDPYYYDWKPDEARAAWSHGLLNLSLQLAIVYPILSVIVYWAVTNRDGGFGSLVLIEGGETAWRRAGAIGLLSGSLTAAIIAQWARNHWEPRLALVATSLAVAVAFGVAFAVAFAFADAFAVAVAVTFAGAVAFAVAVAFVIAGSVVLAVAFVVAGTVALAVAGGVVVAVVLAQERAGRERREPKNRMLYLLLCAIVMFVAVAAAVRFTIRVPPEASSTILFLVILPLLNAAADFGSTGLTRWRLRMGLSGRMWREMLIDLGGAAATFFVLGALSILTIHHLRWSDGSALLDLPEFFTDIRANPGHYWWLYFTLFSTLIPTVLHGAVAVFGTGIHLWPWLRRFIVEGLDAGGRGDVVAGRWAVWVLCLSMTVSIVAPVFVMGHIVTYHGIVGGWVLDLFEGFAQLVGAIP